MTREEFSLSDLLFIVFWPLILVLYIILVVIYGAYYKVRELLGLEVGRK